MILADLPNGQVTLWTAVAAACDAVLGAFIAGAVTYRITDRSITSAETMAAEQRSHELEMAREERLQRRREDAYLAMLASVEMGRLRLSRLRPKFGPAMTPPSMPREEDWAAIEARVAAFGSEKMKNLYTDWWKRFGEFHNTVIELDGIAGTPGGMPEKPLPPEWPELHAMMNKKRDDAFGIAQKLELLVYEELNTSGIGVADGP